MKEGERDGSELNRTMPRLLWIIAHRFSILELPCPRLFPRKKIEKAKTKVSVENCFLFPKLAVVLDLNWGKKMKNKE